MSGWKGSLWRLARRGLGALGWLAPPGTRRRRAARWCIDRVMARVYSFLARTKSQPGPDAVPRRGDLERFLAELGRHWPGEGASYRLLDLLLAHPELRTRFPDALVGGPSGPFGAWLGGPEAASLGVRAEEIALLRETLHHRPGLRVTHLYDQVNALRRGFPLGLTPAGRPALVACLLRNAGKVIVELDEAVWFLLEMAESSTAGLAEAYRRQPSWQLAVPHGLTRFGWDELKRWVRETYRLPNAVTWLDQAQRPDDLSGVEELYWLTVACPELANGDVRTDAARARRAAQRAREAGLGGDDGAYWRRLEDELRSLTPGVNLLAHFRYPSGLQIAALHTVQALEGRGVPVSRRDVPSNVRADLLGREGWLGLHPHRVTISHLAPDPLAEDCYPLCGLARRKETYRIGYWYWELEDAPRRWARHAGWMNEVWAPTRFIAAALRRVLPLPVLDMLPGIDMPPQVEISRKELGLPEDCYLFLFVFDMGSTAARKNPLATIAAFRRAFGPRDDAGLVVKVSRGWADAAALAELRAAADGRQVIVIDEVAPRKRVFALMAACDAYVSLHRSEGFGLTMAEAMALGKPVIATRYSGNLDFMTDRNSLLVDYRKVPVAHTTHLYRKGCAWAEPSVDHAAELMRWLTDSPARGRAVGERARQDVRATLSLEAAGARMARRLEELGGALPLRRAG